MNPREPIYILGSGAIGFPLAAYLANAGRPVIAVRTSRGDVLKSRITVNVHNGAERISAPVDTISLSKLAKINGTIVVTAKSYANEAIARELKDKGASGPVVIMQNGLGVEKPFLEARCSPIYRCILYVTSQAVSENEFSFRPVTASPIGIIHGDEAGLETCVEDLTTAGFPFRPEADIQREIWKKAIINSVFNSICPLLEVDNGVFVRDKGAESLAREVIRECVMLTDRLDLGISERELMDQIRRISKASDGQLISTLQDIKNGRQTEIESLNLEIARVGSAMRPELLLPKTEMLGKMILVKAVQRCKIEGAR